MKRVSKAIKVGGKLYLGIDKQDQKNFEINRNDDIAYEIKENITRDIVKTHHYRCVKCLATVDLQEGDDLYCPACNNDDENALEEIMDFKEEQEEQENEN